MAEDTGEMEDEWDEIGFGTDLHDDGGFGDNAVMCLTK